MLHKKKKKIIINSSFCENKTKISKFSNNPYFSYKTIFTMVKREKLKGSTFLTAANAGFFCPTFFLGNST